MLNVSLLSDCLVKHNCGKSYSDSIVAKWKARTPFHMQEVKRIKELILASTSPRRKILIARLGLPVKFVVPNSFETPPLFGESPERYVSRMAVLKATYAVDNIGDNQLVVGSDTSVVVNGKILGKPESVGHAREMLRELRGTTHTVITSIVVSDHHGELCSVTRRSLIHMRKYFDKEIDKYIATGDPMDKAGGYAIQSKIFKPVERVEGCYTSVVGLPICALSKILFKKGVLKGISPCGDLMDAREFSTRAVTLR